MKLTKLKNEFPNLTAKQILEKIALGSIAGLWLSKNDIEKAKKLYKIITEKEAEKILDSFDKNRQANYNYWRMFN